MKTVKLDQTAFNAELLAIVGTNKIGWSGEDHIKLVTAFRTLLKDEEGEVARFNEQQTDRLTLIFRPTEELQKKVLTATVREAGYTLDEATAETSALLFSVAQFAEFLATNNKPETQEKFILKEKKRGAKKKAFASLIGAVPAAPTTPQADVPVEQEGRDPAGDEQAQATDAEVEQPEAVPQPAPAPKAAAKK